MIKFFFDLSTSARWSGHAVGIVRVERELGRRLKVKLGDQGGFCLYNPSENGIRLLPDDAAQAIIAGELQIRFDRPTPGSKRFSGPTIRRRLRDSLINRPRLYQQVQRMRGRSLSLEQINQIRLTEKAEIEAPKKKGPIVRFIDDVAPIRLPLAPNVIIISAGLDWEHKSIRGIYRMKQAHDFRYAAVVYDLIPLLYPHYVVPAYVDLLRDYFGELFWLTDYCVAISECTQKDMLEHCEDFGIPTPSAAHFPLGGDLPNTEELEDDVELPARLVGKRYAIFVSTIEPRKNHRTLYQAWDRCIREGRVDPERDRLLFVGMAGWNTGDLLNEIAANPATRDTIVMMSSVSDAELRRLYDGAAFSVFPSFYEGYGLPVAEALSHGKPCICSGTGSLKEIAGDLITYCDPYDPIAWADALAKAFNDPEYLDRQADVIAAQYHRPTWDESADLFFAKLLRLVDADSAMIQKSMARHIAAEKARAQARAAR